MDKTVTMEENGIIESSEVISEDCDRVPETCHDTEHSTNKLASEPAEEKTSSSQEVTTDGCQESVKTETSAVHITSPQPIVASSAANVGATNQLPATRLMALSSPIPSLVESLRMTAVKTMKRTRQSLAEKLRHGSKTVDLQLDGRIAALRDIQHRYTGVMKLVNSFSTHFSAVLACHQALDSEFSDLAQKMPELCSEFTYNAGTQRVLHKNGETLLGVVAFFSKTLSTLCFTTIEDTLLSVKHYEDARIEYDAYRVDVETKQASAETQAMFQQHKLKFEQMRQTVDVKLQLLDENRVKVMHQQLLLFHNAIAAYFSGNQAALNEAVQQFSVPRSPTALDATH